MNPVFEGISHSSSSSEKYEHSSVATLPTQFGESKGINDNETLENNDFREFHPDNFYPGDMDIKSDINYDKSDIKQAFRNMNENDRAAGGDCHFMPFIRTVQRIVLYMTKSRIYIVGSNNMENKFRVLKIDRTEPRSLKISDDKTIYSQKEIRELLVMIDTGNRSKSSNQRIGSGLQRTHSAYGIIGFVRFLQGYYILLIKSRKRVAMVGQHCIYKILDTDMVYIPNEEAARSSGSGGTFKLAEETVSDIGSGVNGDKLGTG